jgi:hypothetical protein
MPTPIADCVFIRRAADVLRTAVADELIPSNPADGVERSKPRRRLAHP